MQLMASGLNDQQIAAVVAYYATALLVQVTGQMDIQPLHIGQPPASGEIVLCH